MTETNENRKPRIFLIGNPDKTGFAHDKSKPSSLDDPLSRRWRSCVSVVGWLVYKKYGSAAPFENFTTEWFKRELCFIESPMSDECYELVKAAKGHFDRKDEHIVYDDDAIARLFAYSPLITDCSIPMPGTEARVWFDLMLDTRAEDGERAQRINTELRKMINELDILASNVR